jgi:hypothetical protein
MQVIYKMTFNEKDCKMRILSKMVNAMKNTVLYPFQRTQAAFRNFKEGNILKGVGNLVFGAFTGLSLAVSPFTTLASSALWGAAGGGIGKKLNETA